MELIRYEQILSKGGVTFEEQNNDEKKQSSQTNRYFLVSTIKEYYYHSKIFDQEIFTCISMSGNKKK